MHSPLTLTTVLTAFAITASAAARSEYRPLPSHIARGPASETPKEDWTSSSFDDEYRKCFQSSTELFNNSSCFDLLFNVMGCLHELYIKTATTSDLTLTARNTPSVSRTFPSVVISTGTTPTCTTTLYTEPLITFGPTSTAWADTITSVRSVDCSGCDLAILYGGHVYRQVDYTTTVTVPSSKTEYTAECMASP